MNKKSYLIMAVAVILFSNLIIAAECIAQNYYIDWVAVQHRVYEGGRTTKILGFDLRDDVGNYVTDLNIVTDVKLYDPHNNAVRISPSDNALFYYGYGHFNIGSASWIYDDEFPYGGFNYDILDQLVIGDYHLKVTTSDAQLLEKTTEFIYLFDMPAISHRSFQIHSDSSGNLYWMWDIPKQLFDVADAYSIQIRPQIIAYRNNKANFFLQPYVPVQMACLFVPQAVVQKLIDSGDTFVFCLQVRTDNNNARSYSDYVTVNDIYTEIDKKKSAVVIPLY